MKLVKYFLQKKAVTILLLVLILAEQTQLSGLLMLMVM